MIAPEARLYLILTSATCRADPLETAERALAGGVDLIQFRAKDAKDAVYLELASAIVRLCAGHDVPVILNDRVHLVEASGAAGAHVGEADSTPEEARRHLGPDRLLGLSTHDHGEVAAARSRGADHVGLGPIFASRTKTSPARSPGGPDLVRTTLGATDLPLFPIGGITLDNAPGLIEAGATRLAVGAAICSAPDPAAAARGFKTLLADAFAK